MFKKLLGIVGLGVAAASVSAAAPPSGPYTEGSAAGSLYGLLFCDDPAGFLPKPTEKPANWQAALFGPSPDPAKVEQLAADKNTESRVRALAYNWLRSHGRGVPKGEVLGVIIEMPMDGGLDVLASYADGRVRYLNQSGKAVILEPGGLPKANRMAKELVQQSSALVAKIGPWDKARLPPPQRPNMRITFVVSDGLYFGQGPVSALMQDPEAAPLIDRGARIMKLLVDQTMANQD